MLFPGSLLSWFSWLRELQTQKKKQQPQTTELTLELLQIQKQRSLKVGLSIVTFDSFERETKGPMISPMLDHKQDNPIKSDRGYAWQTYSSRGKMMIRFQFEAMPCCALFCFVTFVFPHYPCPPNCWPKSCLGCALTQWKSCFYKLQWQLKLCLPVESARSY